MAESQDHLFLAQKEQVLKMLGKLGNNKPKPEHVVFSDYVIKINRREKEQTRVLLITDKAVYNLMHNNFGKCKRRISMEKLARVTASQVR